MMYGHHSSSIFRQMINTTRLLPILLQDCGLEILKNSKNVLCCSNLIVYDKSFASDNLLIPTVEYSTVQSCPTDQLRLHQPVQKLWVSVSSSNSARASQHRVSQSRMVLSWRNMLIFNWIIGKPRYFPFNEGRCRMKIQQSRSLTVAVLVTQ